MDILPIHLIRLEKFGLDMNMLDKIQMHDHQVLLKPMPKFQILLLYRGKLRIWNGKKLLKIDYGI